MQLLLMYNASKDLPKTSRSFLCHYAVSTLRQPVYRKRRCHTSGLSQCLLPESRLHNLFRQSDGVLPALFSSVHPLCRLL